MLTLLLSFTGYLLPDDQLGFWAVTVGTNMARATPLLGHEGPFGAQLGMTPYNDVRFALAGRLDRGRQRPAARLYLALHRHSPDRAASLWVCISGGCGKTAAFPAPPR